MLRRRCGATLTRVSGRVIQAAGAVTWRPVGHRVEVLLIHRQRYDDWTFPKGKLDPGEHAVTAAVREVHEETGVAVRLGPPVAKHSYPQQSAVGTIKHVTYWSARPTTSNGAEADRYEPNDEVDDVRWCSLDAASSTLTYRRDLGVLKHFGRAAKRLAHRSSPLVILRHGSATSRKAWPGDDRKRPLADDGLAQGDQLVPLLRAYGIETVISSNSRRCVQTVQPYAAAVGAEVIAASRWSEESASRVEVGAAVAELLADKQRTVLCTHRPLLPWVFKALGVPAVKLTPGQALIVHRRKGDIVGTELLKP